MPKQSPLIPKLLAILEAHGWKAPWWPGDPPSDLEIRRVRAGRHQRSAGAWSWFLWSPSHPLHHDVGSQYTASEVVGMGADGTEIYENPWNQTAILPKPRTSK